MSNEPTNLLITNASIIDGSGAPARPGRVAVSGGRIAAVGPEVDFSPDRTIDAGGMVVAPGFMDTHTHDDLYLFHDPMNVPKLRQGVTTVVIGNCGISTTPFNPDTQKELFNLLGLFSGEMLSRETCGEGDFGQFLDNLEAVRPGMNVIPLVGHTTLRVAAMGSDNRAPNEEEMARMEALTDQAMQQGAFGLSLGLLYPPSAYARTEELVALSRVVAARGGLFTTHMRNESDLVMESLEETLAISRQAGLPAVVSHHKVGGRNNWGRSRDTLNLIDSARRSGLEIHADQYPYTAASTYLAVVLPPELQIGGPEVFCSQLKSKDFRRQVRERIAAEDKNGWENVVQSIGYEAIVIASSPNRPETVGRSVADLARELGQDPLDVIFDIIVADQGSTGAIYHSMDDEDLERIMGRDFVMFGTDGLPAYHPEQKVHPRLCGTFPKILGRYVREKGIISLEEAVRRMTSLPARVFGLPSKGLVKPGYDADLVIFDPETVIDTATFQNPLSPPEGIPYVLVGGGLALEEGRPTDWAAGRVLRHGIDDSPRA